VSGTSAVVGLALRYWAAVFAIGVALGTGRTLWLAPRTGALAAVLIELPLMLAASWLIARRLLARHPLPGRSAALAAGALAFALLMASEAALAIGLGGTAEGWLAALVTPAGLAGLFGQFGFAVLPALLWPRPGPQRAWDAAREGG